MPWPWSMWLSACILWWRNLRIAVGAEAIDMAMFQEPQLVNVKTEDGRHVMAAVGGGWSHVRLIEAHPLGWPCMKRAQVLEQQHGWFDKGLSLSSQKILYEEMAEWARMHFDGEAPGMKRMMLDRLQKVNENKEPFGSVDLCELVIAENNYLLHNDKEQDL
eukprot:TRINITY_DN45700_c0_g1_i2.p1 TRINITY_DN45700_c0_g1~~TRINITY_DN45700_c0_g1_i2.p1  ORF type:complete len:161 (+),score=35.42 TRINITY_DN45700_c0_g1_i2:65-547(+)